MAVGIKQNFRPLQRRQARRFGIPLVPANADADLAVAGRPGAEPDVARRKVELLVVERIIRNVHFPINAQQTAVRVNHRRAVVVKAGAAPLEEGGDDDHFEAAGQLLQGAVLGPGIGSASLKYSWSSLWQKYCERKSSCVQMICAPRRAAAAMRSRVRAKFSSGSGEQRDWISPSVTAGDVWAWVFSSSSFHRRRAGRPLAAARRGRLGDHNGFALVLAGGGRPACPKSSRMNLPRVSLVGP